MIPQFLLGVANLALTTWAAFATSGALQVCLFAYLVVTLVVMIFRAGQVNA